MVEDITPKSENSKTEHESLQSTAGRNTGPDKPSDTSTDAQQATQHKWKWPAIREWIKEIPVHNKIELLFTFVIAIATSIYTIVSCNQLVVMSRQLTEVQTTTKLTRQQLVGLQGAVIEVSPVWDATKQVLSTTLVNSNQNGVSGVVSNFRAKLQRKTWPKEQPLGEPFIIELLTPEVTILRGGQFPIEKGLPWPLPPQIKDLSLWPGNKVVTLEGSFTYDDGFGDLHPYSFCYLWTAPWNLTSPKAGGWSGGQWSGGKQGCPTVQEKVNEFLGYKAVFERANR